MASKFVQTLRTFVVDTFSSTGNPQFDAWILRTTATLNAWAKLGTNRIQGRGVPEPTDANDGMALVWKKTPDQFDYADLAVGTVTAVTATAPISSTGGTTPDISHDTSGVTPGSYTSANITVDEWGHLTAAASGGSGGTVTNVTATAPISSSGGTTPNITHDNSGVSAASYAGATITVDAKGHVTAASANPVLPSGVENGDRIQYNGSIWAVKNPSFTMDDAPASASASDDEFSTTTVTRYSPAAWVTGTFTQGTPVLNGGLPYVCITAGTSITGPTGTSSNSTDGGTAHWKYTGATPWANATYAVGDQVTNAGNLYVCTTLGTSTVAPTGTSNNQAPGGASHWAYMGSPTNPLLPTEWARSTSYAQFALCSCGTNIYLATQAGTGTSSASGTGPSGTGSSISDNTVTWAYVGLVSGTFNGWSVIMMVTATVRINALPSTSPIDTAMTLGTYIDPTTTLVQPSWKWDAVNRPGALRIQVPNINPAGNVGSIILYKQVTPASSATFWAGVGSSGRNSTQSGSDGRIDFILTNAFAPGQVFSRNASQLINVTSTNYLYFYTDVTNPVSTVAVVANNSVASVRHIGILKSGGTYWGMWATPSDQPITTASGTSTAPDAMTCVQLLFWTNSATTPGNNIYEIRYFRYFAANVAY